MLTQDELKHIREINEDLINSNTLSPADIYLLIKLSCEYEHEIEKQRVDVSPVYPAPNWEPYSPIQPVYPSIPKEPIPSTWTTNSTDESILRHKHSKNDN